MTELRYFDGETWWYDQRQVAREIGMSVVTITKWRKAEVAGEPLVRTRKQGTNILVPLVDVFYVIDNKARLLGAGVRLTPEAERKAKAEYVRTLQHISLDFAKRQGVEYTVTEIDEFENREGTVFEEAIRHGRTYFGGQYAARMARDRKEEMA